jgi:hypothetical protein
MKAKFSGVFPALVTHVKEGGDVDYQTFDRLLDFVLEREVTGVAVGGATAEYPHFSLEKREALITDAAERIGEEEKLLAAVGASTIHTTLELGKQNIRKMRRFSSGVECSLPIFLSCRWWRRVSTCWASLFGTRAWRTTAVWEAERLNPNSQVERQ